MLRFLCRPPVARVLSSGGISQEMPVLALPAPAKMGSGVWDTQSLLGPLADDALKSVSEEKVRLSALVKDWQARFLSVNDVIAKSAVLALSAPGWVGPGGRNLEILFGVVVGDARNSVSEERIGLTSLGDSPVAGVLPLDAVFAGRLGWAFSSPC